MSSSYQPFGYEGKPGTCLWCGRKLRYETIMDPASDKPYPENLIRAEHAGYYQDDTFDTQSCGYRFGLQQAKLGNTSRGAENVLGAQFSQDDARLLDEVTRRMGTTDPRIALQQSLATILALYQAADEGGQPKVRYPRHGLRRETEQDIHLPGVLQMEHKEETS